MAGRDGRTTPCSATERAGRFRKAQLFLDAAEAVSELWDEDQEIADVYVTLNVHARIAAADVICCRALGKHSRGESHTDAVALLASVDVQASGHLSTLLALKTRAGYSALALSAAQRRKAERAAGALMRAATVVA
jgi:hypothetical protein